MFFKKRSLEEGDYFIKTTLILSVAGKKGDS